MILKFRFFNIKLNKIFNVINVDLYNEQVDCLLEKQYLDIITWDIKNGVLMQSTGLYDVNENEIFEGDIVQCWYEKGFVVMRQGSWFIETNKKNLCSLYEYLDEAIVIGNIHEHPKLLNKLSEQPNRTKGERDCD